MDRIVVEGRLRTELGTAPSRRHRFDGWVPANIYGHGQPNVHFMVRHEQILRLVNEEHHLMTIDIDGKHDSGLLKEIQFDTFGDHIVHVDFTRVSLDEVIETTAAVHTAGTAKGASSGGTLDILRHEIPLKGKAVEIPEFVEIDVTDMVIGDAVRVRELNLPAGVECLLDAEEIVVIVHGKALDEDEAEPETTE